MSHKCENSIWNKGSCVINQKTVSKYAKTEKSHETIRF